MNKFKLGLSLSGGGYRAAAYHLGTLRKLEELKLLHEVDVLSTISGGTIIGAYYCLKKDNFDNFSSSLYKALQTKGTVGRVLGSVNFIAIAGVTLGLIILSLYSLFTSFAWIFPVIWVAYFIVLFKFQFNIFPVSRIIENIWDEFFYDGKTLGDLPDKPVLVMGTSNLNTSRLFTFSKNWMQDSTYQFLKDENGNEVPVRFIAKNFPVTRASIASSCVPFAFTPITIDREFFQNPERDFDRINPQLVDGGVYDNQGIHKIMQTGDYKCEFRIVSDAGNKVPQGFYKNTISLLIQTVDVFMARIKNVQMVQGIYTENTIEKEIAYVSLGWDVKNCIPGFINNLEKKQVPLTVVKAHKLKDEWIASPKVYEEQITTHLKANIDYSGIEKIAPTKEELVTARSVGTSLSKLSKAQVDALIKQAEAMTEIQVKLYCPTLFNIHVIQN